MNEATTPDDALAAPSLTREELQEEMPLRVRRAFPTFNWTEEALWRLELPIEEVPVETFDWLLDLPIWRWQGRRFQLSLRDVLNDPDVYGAHHKKAEDADTAYPIHISKHRGHWVILDGYHRLLKTLIHDRRTIKVMKVQAADLASSKSGPLASGGEESGRSCAGERCRR